MSRHRAEPVRPRWGRMVLAGLAAVITTTSMVGAAVVGSDEPTTAVARDLGATDAPDTVTPAPVDPTTPEQAATEQAAPVPDAPEVEDTTAADAERAVRRAARQAERALPADSGDGRRVVFSESRQRVWLVDGDGVQRTYLVSGSIYDNLDPGSYEVYSRSEDAIGIDDSGTMSWFVRFTRGDNAAIGFHDIPVAGGEPVQTFDQLGTPLSHGCIRQKESDALALWDFAPLGTSVVVTA